MDQPKPEPLQGIRVIDFTTMMAGPLCTRYLADAGADVIKIEAPEGDYIRQREPMRDGQSAYFGHLNAGKRSVVLDLKLPASIEAVKRLVASADVLVEAFRPGVMKRLGLDDETLWALNPRLVYASISGFGQTGPAALRPAYAQIVQAASGYETAFATYQGEDEGEANRDKRPANAAIFHADILSGLFAYAGVVTALQQRERTGRGERVDTSLFDSMLNLMPYEVQEAQFPAKKRRPVYTPLRASDGYVMVSAISPRLFETLLDTVEIPAWRDDPAFATEKGRQGHWNTVMARIEDWTGRRSVAECERVIGGAGVPISAYRSVREALADDQLAHRGSLAEVTDPAGSFKVPNLPFRFVEGRVEVRARVPRLGEHTDEVLAQAGLPALTRR